MAEHVPQDLESAYQRAVQGERFEGLETEATGGAQGTGRERRARAQLRWEQTADGKKWLEDNGPFDVAAPAGDGTVNVAQDTDSAYKRAVAGNRFEGQEREATAGGFVGTPKERRAQAQLEWEQTADGKQWLIDNPQFASIGSGDVGQPQMLYRDSEAYKALPDALKELVDTSFATLFQGTEEDFVKLNEAIRQAQKIVDPFFAAQLALTRASIIDTVARTTKSFEFGEEAIQRIRDELMEDIALAGGQLGLEEQAQIAKVLRDFDQTALSLKDAAALTGRTFGQGRFTLSEDIGQAQIQSAEILQSTRRQANFERQRLSLRAQQGDREAQARLAELESEFGCDIRKIGREAEALVGTREATGLATDAPQLAGAGFVGGVLGDIEVRRQKAFGAEVGTFFRAQGLSEEARQQLANPQF